MHSCRYFLNIAGYQIRIIKLRKIQEYPHAAMGSGALLSRWQSGVNVRSEHGTQPFAFNHFSLF